MFTIENYDDVSLANSYTVTVFGLPGLSFDNIASTSFTVVLLNPCSDSALIEIVPSTFETRSYTIYSSLVVYTFDVFTV